jgi:hypothetical protein
MLIFPTLTYDPIILTKLPIDHNLNYPLLGDSNNLLIKILIFPFYSLIFISAGLRFNFKHYLYRFGFTLTINEFNRH